MSTESSEPIAPPEARPAEAPSEGKRGVYDLLQALRLSLQGGKLDPITALLVMSEMRRIDRDEQRWELERQRLMQPPPNPSKEVDFEKLIGKINEAWEKRFAEYQSNIEKLLLKGKVEEAESKAEKLEKELKEMKEKIEHEKLLEEKVSQAITPYKEQISQLQQLLAEKTRGMSENEKRGFFQSLGEQIEQSLSQEVTGTIAKTVSEAIINAFTPKEEKEVPVTAEGKVDVYKMVDKWVREGLKTVQTIAQRWPQQKPPSREVRKIPMPQTTATTPTTSTTPPETIHASPPTETAVTTAPPAEVTTSTTISPVQPPPTSTETLAPETPKEQPSQEPKPEQSKPEAKPEIPEQPKQEAKPETEEKQPARTKPRKHRETTEESPQKQES